MKVRNRILLLSSLLLLVSVGGIGNLMWQLPRIEQMQDMKSVFQFLILLGLFGAGLVFSVLELVRHEIMSPIFQLAAEVARLKERKIAGHRFEFTGSKDIDLLTRALNDLLDDFQKEKNFYRIFAETSPDMIFLLDREGRVLFGNMNAARQWNCQAEEIIGKRQEELFPPDIAERHKQVIQKIFETGRPVFIDVHEKIGGRDCWLDARMIPVLNKDGRVTAVLCISRDITERKKLEEHVQRVNQSLLSLGDNFKENANRITALCGELLGGACALYNRLEGEVLYAAGQWQAPPDFNPKDSPYGHICYDVIRGTNELVFIPDLLKTRYAETDPNVRRYDLKSYLGHPVRCGGETVGSLCVVFQQPFAPTENDKRLLSILASALSVEEKRNKAELEAFESRRLIQAIFNQTFQFIGLMKTDGILIQANKTALQFAGVSESAVIGKPFWDTPWWTHDPEQQERLKKAVKTCSTGQMVRFEATHLTPDGGLHYVDFSLKPFRDDTGKIIYLIPEGRDITKRIEAENKSAMLSRAIETAHHGCLIISEDARVLFVNDYGLAKLGLVLEEVKERRLDDFCTDKELIKNAMATMRITKRWIGETVLNDQDGRRFPVLVSISKLDERNARGGADSILLFQDITVQKEMREKLLASERLAVMGRLVADVAHELNNPLAIIIGGTQFILKQLDGKEPELCNQLERILRNGRRCKTILANLLGYGRTVAKKSEQVNIQELIHEAIDSVSFQYDMSGIETALSCDKLCNVNVAGNRAALLSVFINLVRNARQAMGSKGKLTINLGKQDDDSIRVEISDTGIGMSKEQVENLFKPFVSGWQEIEGSGLGLATSLGIIETHGGKMTAFSNGIGQGTTFVVTLPYSLKENSISQ